MPRTLYSPLVYLNLEGNKIERFDFEFGGDDKGDSKLKEVQHLRKVNLSNNLLREFPYKVFAKQSELQELDLSRNRITNFQTTKGPNEWDFGKFESLMLLDVSSN
jgi:Leucine-rich repeat (LRR) protein